MFKKYSFGWGDLPRYLTRKEALWSWLSLALLLGVGALVWRPFVSEDSFTVMLLALCAVLLLWYPLAMHHQLQLARLERDHALAQLEAMQSQLWLANQETPSCLAVCPSRQVQALQSELTDLRATEMSLRDQVHHDDLTGLGNRLLLADHFQSAVERAKRSGQSFALLMIDLNGFKAINDRYGHGAGDLVLVTTANRLVATVRAVDTVARLGGDEFVLIVESIEDSAAIAKIGLKLMETLSTDIPMATGELVNVSASLGLALYPQDGVALRDLLHRADLAMYECKSTGQISPQ